MAWSDLRHWDPMLSSPREMLFAIVNILDVLPCCENSWKHRLLVCLMLLFRWWSFLSLEWLWVEALDGNSCAPPSAGVLLPRRRKGTDCLGCCCWTKAGCRGSCLLCILSERYLGHSIVFKLKVEFLFVKGNCFAVDKAFAGFLEVNWDSFIVHLWGKEEHFDRGLMQVPDSVSSQAILFYHVIELLSEDVVLHFLFVDLLC